MYNSYIKYKQKYLNLKKLLNDRQLLGGASSASKSGGSGGATKASSTSTINNDSTFTFKSTTYNDSIFIFGLIVEHFEQIKKKIKDIIEKIISLINIIKNENDIAYYWKNQNEINDNISLIKDLLIDLYKQEFLSIEQINNVNLSIIQIKENIKELTKWANWELKYSQDIKTFKENIKEKCKTILDILDIQNILDKLDDKFIKYDLSSIISFIKNTKTIYNFSNSGNILIIDGEKFSYHINFLEMIKLFFLENNKDNIYNYYILLLNIRLYSIYSQFKTIDKLRSLKDEIIQYFTIKKEEEEEERKEEEREKVEREGGNEVEREGGVEEGGVKVEEVEGEVKEVEEGGVKEVEEKVEGGVKEKVEGGVKEGGVKEGGVKEGEVKEVEGGVKKKKKKNVKINSSAGKSPEMIIKIKKEELIITIMIEEIQKQIDAETIKTDSHILPWFDKISKFDNSLTMFILLEILSNFVYNKANRFSLFFDSIDQTKRSKVFITYNSPDFLENICTLNTISNYKLYYLYNQNKYYYSKFSMFLYKYYDFKKFKVFIIPSTTHSIDILQQIKHIPSLLTSAQLTSAQSILDKSTDLNKIIEAILIIFKNINKDINKESIVCALYSIIYSKNYNKIFIPTTTFPILIIDGSNLSYNIDLLKMIKQFIINNTSEFSELSKLNALIILNVRLYSKIMHLLSNTRQKLIEIETELTKLSNPKKYLNRPITDSESKNIKDYTEQKIIQEKELSKLEELYKIEYEPLIEEIKTLRSKVLSNGLNALFNFAKEIKINETSKILEFNKKEHKHLITSILVDEILPLFLYSFLPIETHIHITMNCANHVQKIFLTKYENFFVHDSICEYIKSNESDDFIVVFLYMLFLTNNKDVYLWTYDNYLWYKEQFPNIIQIEQIPNSFKLHYTTLKPNQHKIPEHIIYKPQPPP